MILRASQSRGRILKIYQADFKPEFCPRLKFGDQKNQPIKDFLTK